MYIRIDLKDIIKEKQINQVNSIRLNLIEKNKKIEYKGIFIDNIAIIKTDINFIEDEKYRIIISIVNNGKQIYKEKIEFIYKANTVFIIPDKMIKIKIIKNEKEKENNIYEIKKISQNTYKKYKYIINPLAIVREEDEKSITIFINNNVYILKGKLAEIFKNINNKTFVKKIREFDKLNEINLLILKGCIICYE